MKQKKKNVTCLQLSARTDSLPVRAKSSQEWLAVGIEKNRSTTDLANGSYFLPKDILR